MKYFLLFVTVYIFGHSLAQSEEGAAKRWYVVTEESSVNFEAIQNNAPVTGEFKQFAADIYFDPQQLEQSKVVVKVDMGSVLTSYQEVAANLKTPVWFNVEEFPQALFTTQQIRHIGGDNYEAKALLTIRGHSVPVTFAFTLDEYGNDRAAITGNTTLNRSDYAIGQGEWAGDDAVKHEVKVQVKLSAKKQ